MQYSDKNMGILILAAGAASRMGEIKQLLPFGNTTLLGTSILTAISCSTDVYVVLGANSDVIKEQIKEKVTLIDNENWEMGMGTSIACGVQHLMHSEVHYDTCLIMLADQPFIDVDHVSNIIKVHNENNKGITATTYKNRVGVPVIFDSNYFEELSQLSGDNGAKEILDLHINDLQSIDSKGKTLDIDTKEEYQNILK